VSRTDRLTMTRSRLRLPRRTVRLRLTLLYSLLFLVAGAGLLAITYALVRSFGNFAVPPVSSPRAPGSKSLSAPTPAGWKQAQLKAQALATHAADLHELHNLHERLALPGPGDEIKDLADTIDGLLHRLEAAFGAQRRFVANASHELRTPLTLSRALLDVTLANPRATVDDLRTMGQELIAFGEQQEQLIDALLTLATSERGLEQHEPFDLSEITADVLLGPHPEINQLGLDVQTAMTAAPAIGGPRLAERLVANLIDNALRHNVTGGHVNVATRTESGHAILTITNSGPVIPQHDIDRLFQPFQRLDSDRANHPDGHGLGLSIVQSIAAAHRATLSARTRPRGGLHIEVRFPPVPSNRKRNPLTQRPDTSSFIRSRSSARAE
jgi:signal transduction histidine kinase